MNPNDNSPETREESIKNDYFTMEKWFRDEIDYFETAVEIIRRQYRKIHVEKIEVK